MRQKVRWLARSMASPAGRAHLFRSTELRLRHVTNPRDDLFQPYNDTSLDRYPAIFRFLQGELAAIEEPRVLSFGCSTGEEVFSLRGHVRS